MEQLLFNRILNCELFDKGQIINLKEPIYPFTTENISAYIDFFELKDKSLLTVGSSGDQVINAILHNCKDITLYDIVPDTKYYYFLKVAGLLSLSKKEFLEFFRFVDYNDWRDNKKVFNQKLYNKLKPTLRLLDYDSYLYFDELFNTFSGITVRNALFRDDEYNTRILVRSNDYLKSTILYEETRKKIKKIKPKFICKNIFDISSETTYDNIWLSNIATWLKTEEEILKLVEKNYECLNENGRMLVSYLYKTTSKNIRISSTVPAYNLNLMFKLLKSYKIELREFDGVKQDSLNPIEKQDSILILTK